MLKAKADAEKIMIKMSSLLGFKVKATGCRKYRSAYIQVPRKNAKSTVATILANGFLVMEQGQQDIYIAAVSRDQARIVFDDARQMCLLSRPLKKRVAVQQHKVTYAKSDSLLKPLAAKTSTVESTNPSLAIVDEYHLHPDNAVYSALELGMGARPESILFALIYELDDENEIDDETLWIKANPNLDVSVDSASLHDTIQKARGIPSQRRSGALMGDGNGSKR